MVIVPSSQSTDLALVPVNAYTRLETREKI